MGYNENAQTFEATDVFGVSGSSFVDVIAYDIDENELLVRLDSGDYLYEGVPATTYRNFKAAHSKGQFYNNWIKRGSFGNADDVTGVAITDKGVKAPDMGGLSLVGSSFPFDSNSLTTLNIASGFTATADGEPRTFAVRFTAEGGNNVKTHTVEASGFDAAAAAVQEVADILGVTLNVKGVDVVE